MKAHTHPNTPLPSASKDYWHSDASFRFIVEAMPNAVFLTNAEGRILLANAESERLFGYSREELLDQPIETLIPARFRSHHPNLRSEYTRQAETRPMGHGRDLHALSKSGVEIPVEVGLNPMQTPDGLLIVAIVIDITERKTAEKELQLLNADLERRVQERTALLQNFLDSFPGLYLVLTRNFEIAGTSDAYLAATMTKRTEITGRNIFDVFPENPATDGSKNQGDLRASLEHVLEHAESHTMGIIRYDIPKPDGSFEKRYWSPVNSPVLSTDGEVQFIIHRAEDVTAFMLQKPHFTEDPVQNRILQEHMEAEIFSNSQKVQEINRQLEAANKELEAFSYSVSHDLRASLRAIDGFSLAVVEDYNSLLPEEGQRYLKTIRESAQRMGALIDDLLAFSRLSRQLLNLQTVSMKELVEAVIGELTSQIGERPVDIRIADLAPAAGDFVLLRQVWTNLLSNALKYSRHRDPAIIEIGSRESEEGTVYFVRDNGSGFDMRYVEKLFGVFQRLHRVEDYEGTGVGLAIVQRIIHRHGGRIWAQGEENRGATFSFTLSHPL